MEINQIFMEQRVVEMAFTRGQHDNSNSYCLLLYLMPVIVAPALYTLSFNPGHFFFHMSEKHQEDKQFVQSPYLYFSYYTSRFGEICILFLAYFSLRFMFGYKSMNCFLLYY